MKLDGYILEINEGNKGLHVQVYHCYEDDCLGKLYLSKEQQKTLEKIIKECKKS